MLRLLCALAVLLQSAASPSANATRAAAGARQDADVVVIGLSWHRFTVDPNAVELTPDRSATVYAERGYQYKLKVRNSGAKTITALFWEYRFGDRSDSPDGTRRQFLCWTKMKPGASKGLEVFSTLPPLNVISASSAGRKEQDGVAANVVFNRVEYADGTSWERADWKRPKRSESYGADLYPSHSQSGCLGFREH